MTLQKDGLKYEDSKEPSKVTKGGIRVITAMSTPRIVWFVLNRHRVGLLGLSTVTMFSYMVYDKVGRHFI